MKVICRYSSGEALPPSTLDERINVTRETSFALTVGRAYPVYCATIFRGDFRYYVFDDNERPYPFWYSAHLFQISDGSLPRTWQVGWVESPHEGGYPVISFPEWASDHHFYERLVDGDPHARAIFEARRSEIEG